jgi:Tfp pilus assembly protein PilF
VHPLRLENVAWISDRKDLLCALFWLLGLQAYVAYTRRPVTSRYLLVVVCMVLGLMSKQMIVTFPFVLLLLDYWPLARLRFRGSGFRVQVAGFRSVLLEKVPLILLSLVFCLTTYLLHPYAGPGKALEGVGLAGRAVRVPLNYAAYLGKVFWPAGLCPMYPRATEVSAGWSVLTGLLLVAVTVAAVRAGRRRGYLAVGWLWFVGTLVPVIGFVQLGNSDVADRFLYVPLLGILIVVAWGLSDVSERFAFGRSALVVAFAASVVACALVTRSLLPHWRNGEALSRRALDVTVGNFIAHNSLGRALEMQGRPGEALAGYRESLRLAPEFAQAHINAGNLLGRMKRYDEALRHLEAALTLDPNGGKLHSNYGSILFEAGRREEGLAHLEQALALDPYLTDARFNYGWALLHADRGEEALSAFLETARMNPRDHLAHFWAGALLLRSGQQDEAQRYLETSVRLAPGNEDYRRVLRNAQP